MKILIVDDRKEERYLLETLLKGNGYEVVSAANGAEALEKLRTETVGMIISDILMPVMDGFRFCKEVKGDEKLKGIPLVFYTATYKDEKDEELASKVGAEKFMRKPMEPDELIKIIQGVIRDVEEGKIGLKKPVLEEEKEVFKLYNERLVKKLEKKMLELEREVSERKRAEERIKHLNLVLSAIRKVNQLIIGEKDPDRLIQGACDSLISTRGYYNAWIALLDESEKLVKTAEAGLGEDFQPMLERLNRGELTYCGRNTLDQSGVLAIKDPVSECDDCPLARMYTGRSGLSARLEHQGKVYGFMTVSVPENFANDEEEQSLFEEVAGDIAYALHNIELEEERRQAEETLRESEEKYRLLVGNATDAIFVSQDEAVKFPNPRTEELVGYSAEELATIRFTDFIHPDDRDIVLDRHRRRLKEESLPTTYSFRIINRAGEELWTQLNTVAITWEGRPATLNFLRDITPQRNLEAQLQQSQKMEAIGTLAGGVAHDFNNLLTTIIGCSDLMMMRIGKDHELRENLEDIRKAGDRAASLTRQLLAFSRRQILEPKVIDLNDVIPDMDKMLRRLIGEDIDLETVLAPGLGRVEADPGQVEQIIMNLAVNARDAMPRGGKLTMETANVDLDEAYARSHADVTPGPYVMMAISDSGTGMGEETLSKAFDPFFTTKEAGKGTGLGLSTVYGIVKQSKGNIWSYSEPGKGTTFKIYLPRVEKDAVEKEEVEATAESLTGSETILVVEDNEMVRGLAQTILQHYGYSVLAAQDGEEAIKVSKEHDGPIDLMLTDVVMPKMSGKEVSERLNTLRPDMKVLYMSGYTGNAIVHHGVLDREMRFIQKPFTTESLARKVREVLD